MVGSRRHLPGFQFLLLLPFLASFLLQLESKCQNGCDLALGSYYVSPNYNLSYIAGFFNLSDTDVLRYNPSIPNTQYIQAGSRANVSFPCDCINSDFLGHVFSYVTLPNDTYRKIATDYYANLTTAAWLAKFNSYNSTQIPDGATINVTVNCSCGNESVSRDYGLFETYPLRPGENLSTVAAQFELSSKEDLLREYNPGVNFSAGEGIVFIPTKDPNGSYRPFLSSTGISRAAIAGISIAVIVLLVLAICLYVGVYRRRKAKRVALLPSLSEVSLYNSPADTPRTGTQPAGITVDKSVEFSYEELAKATDDFSMANKIGEGGFGAVYYAELRGEKAAIKKMDMQATQEFLAELKVLTHVHHLNLVRLIGYCIEGSLFLVYEFIENGNLSQHLRGSARDPLPWAARVQIALDSARGLEYIHEHTVPVYIHRDIKSANILIDKNFHGKVADFGLTKLTEFGSTSLPTRLVGTFGYMPPEYAQYGDVSPKVDVFAFGVVLYELISAKEAIVKTNEFVTESKGLVALFEDALDQPDPKEDLRKLIDPKLGESYPIDSVLKMAQLARACTQANPQLRPSMRSIVVALMTLSSTAEDWDMGSFYDDQALVNLMAGR
ncbi:chitin elicitor receptor kinase 1-like isoform X2 [Phoenix dactylifera]|uniref:non-specific serine/threonine protein kinase n=1 Tax=Phoenix dactylifera TaxID=42345 RepID=A0A8B9AHT2_PHODC|nr:chitin elicitor receptor kinase 1-like isoform X2 [Phoenix dactylifera]